MAQPWASTVEQLRGPAGPAAPAAPTPMEWTEQKLRAGRPTGFDRPPGGVPRSAPYSAPFGATPYPPPGTGAAPTVSQALGAERRLRTMSTTAGRAVGSVAAKAAPIALAADVGSHFNDFKINDPSVDSSASGTFGALRRGDFAGAGRSLSKGMLETGMDLGSAAANIADVFVPGKAPVSSAYGRMLRSTFGDQLADNTGAPPTGGAPSVVTGKIPEAVTSAPTASRPAPATGNAAGTFRYADGSTGKGTVSILDTIGVDGYMRQLENIRSLGTAGPEGGGSGLAGIGGGTLSSALREKHNAQSTAMSTNNVGPRSQRSQDALDMHKASLAQANQGQQQGLRIAEMNNATQRRSNDQNNATSLRGQDIHYAGQMAPLQLAAFQRAQHAAAYATAGAEAGKPITPEQHLAAAKAMHLAGLPDLAAKAEAAAAGGVALKGAGEEQARKGHDDLINLFRGDQRFNIADPANPGKTIFDEAGAKRAAAQLYAEHGEKLDGLAPDKKKAFASEIIGTQRLQDRLRRPEMGAMDHVANWFGQYKRPADNEALPDLKGAKARRRGATLIPGNMTNDILLDLPDGRTYNAGELGVPEIGVLRSRGVNLDR